MPGLRIACFGALQVEVDGQPIQRFETDKSRALLVYLAVENRHAEARSHLAGLLWSDQSEDQAMHSLRQTISSLRKALGDGGSNGSYLLSERDTVRLNPAIPLWVDVHAFQAGIAAACRYYQRRDQGGWLNVRRLEAALTFRNGPFLAHLRLKGGPLFDEWQTMIREDLDQRALQGLALLAEIYEKRGDLGLARQTAQRILEIAPWDEQTHVMLMRLFALDGQNSAAQNQYRVLRRYLQEHLGVEPSEETQALFAKIRSSTRQPTTGLLRFDPLPSNLPALASPFVGRALELDAITDLLADPSCRLLTVLGPGGIGKTRLALEAARQQLGLPPDGVYVVPLAAMNVLDQVYLAIADAVRLVLAEQSDPRARLLDYLRGKRMLLVLDNYEHLLSSQDGVQPVVELLAQAPGLTLLVTSRERLMLQEEWTYLLSGLRYPAAQAEAGLDERMLEQFDALGLFIQRARQAQSGFSINAETLAPTIHICHLLEGLPLGIELAAAAVWDQPIGLIADQLAKHLNAFAAPAVNVQASHRSLWAAFDVSWQSLSPARQAVFCRLGVFQGGFTLQAAHQVAGAEPELLAALVSKSLIRCDGQGRYSLHEAIRQYALDKLADTGAQAASRIAHARYYASWLASLGSRLHGPQQKQAFFEIQEEIGNAHLAWAWLVDHQDFSLIDACVDPLYQFFNLRSRFAEGIEWFQPAAACLEEQAAHSPELAPVFGKLLARVGSLAYYARQNRLALETLERAQAIFSQQNQRAELAFCHTNLGGVYQRAKDFERARACAQQNLDYYQAVDDALGQNRAFYLLGLIESRLGRYRECRQLVQAAIDVGQHLQDPRRLIAPLNLLGDIACTEGSYSEAESLFQRSLAIACDLQDLYYQAIVLNNLATVYHYNHQYQQAHQAYEQSILICKEIGDRDGEAMALNNLGELAVAEGQYEKAVNYSQQALQIARQIGEEWTIAVCLNNLGEASNGVGKYRQALEYLKEAIRTAWEIEAVDQVARFAVNVGRSCQLLGRLQDALAIYRAALAHSATEHDAREKATRWLQELAASPGVENDDSILENLVTQFIQER